MLCFMLNPIAETTAYQNAHIEVCSPFLSYDQEELKIQSRSTFSSLKEWTGLDHEYSHEALKKIASVFKNRQDDYLIFGQMDVNKIEMFGWHAIPYHSTDWTLWKQLKVFWTLLSGPFRVNNELRKAVAKSYRDELNKEQLESSPIYHPTAHDPFCNESQLKKQRIFEGVEVDVLYNYAPTKLDEQLDFLIISKKHRNSFYELSKSEYVEAITLAITIFNAFRETEQANIATIYHKSGKRAGQTVPHWHLHVMLTKNRPSTFIEKVSCIWKGYFRTRLSDEELEKRVSLYSNKLKLLAKQEDVI